MKTIKKLSDPENNPVLFLFWSYAYWLMQMTMSKEALKAHNKRVAARRKAS